MERRDRGGEGIELGALTDWALLFVCSCVAGLLLGLAIRRLGLRWTWGLVALGLAPLAALIYLPAGLAIVVSAVVSCRVGSAWHRQDDERRGVEAQRARERPGPVSMVRSRRDRRRAERSRVEGERIALGVTRGGRVCRVPFGSRQGVRGLIVGAPGTGKTVTMSAMVSGYVARGLPVVCVDPKGDPSLHASLAESANAHGACFREWSHDGSATYNPVGRGGPTEIADKLLAGEEWTEPHYLRQAQRYLGWAVRVMADAGVPVGVASLAERLDPEALEALCDRAPDETAEAARRYLDSLSQRQRSDLGGVRDRIAALAESELGPWLRPGGENAIDLSNAWREGAVLYFRLDSDRYPLASEMLAAAIVSDLVSLTGELQREAACGLVALDEFAAIGARDVLRVLSRSRSAGISVLLATQGLADLEDAVGDAEGGAFARRVLTQLDYLVAHRQPEPESAEVLAAMTRTRPVWVTTRRVDSRFNDPKDATGSRTREREFVRHPDEFKALPVGEAIVLEPGRRREAERVRVWPARSPSSDAISQHSTRRIPLGRIRFRDQHIQTPPGSDQGAWRRRRVERAEVNR